MENIKEFYFLGQPIETEIGLAHFIKVKDYPQLVKYLPYLNIEKFEILSILKSINDNFSDDFNDVPFVVLIRELSSILEIHTMLKGLFTLIFKDDVFDKIKTDEQLNSYKEMIRQMNCVNYEKKNPNPEIERFNQMKKLYNKNKSSGDISLESMVTSVWLSLGADVFDLTIYQLYSLFNRISQFKNYDTTILYNSVSGNVPIEGWFKHIEMIDKTDEIISVEDFEDYATKIMGS